MIPSLFFAGVPAQTGGAASSDPSQGSLPLSSTDQQGGSPLLRDKCIVIVEDEGITLMQLRKVCMLAGMKVVGTAVDGEQGVQKVLETRPDIVLMDIKMPVLDGFSATERILKEYHVCVVMLTAYDLEDYQERAQQLGTCGYIVKPVTAITLIPQLETAYRQFQPRPH